MTYTNKTLLNIGKQKTKKKHEPHKSLLKPTTNSSFVTTFALADDAMAIAGIDKALSTFEYRKVRLNTGEYICK